MTLKPSPATVSDFRAHLRRPPINPNYMWSSAQTAHVISFTILDDEELKLPPVQMNISKWTPALVAPLKEEL